MCSKECYALTFSQRFRGVIVSEEYRQPRDVFKLFDGTGFLASVRRSIRAATISVKRVTRIHCLTAHLDRFPNLTELTVDILYVSGSEQCTYLAVFWALEKFLGRRTYDNLRTINLKFAGLWPEILLEDLPSVTDEGLIESVEAGDIRFPRGLRSFGIDVHTSPEYEGQLFLLPAKGSKQLDTLRMNQIAFDKGLTRLASYDPELSCLENIKSLSIELESESVDNFLSGSGAVLLVYFSNLEFLSINAVWSIENVLLALDIPDYLSLKDVDILSALTDTIAGPCATLADDLDQRLRQGYLPSLRKFRFHGDIRDFAWVKVARADIACTVQSSGVGGKRVIEWNTR
ncbi:hypothetical protein TWF481_011256 [Arthrobotrys musiformis]|uniref:F-box domain-containing protein n=1 Tax=Arthrobotrys musiformis TaxID=47236 RepID=A0AAV9VZX2_9PEZI